MLTRRRIPSTPQEYARGIYRQITTVGYWVPDDTPASELRELRRVVTDRRERVSEGWRLVRGFSVCTGIIMALTLLLN